MVGALLIVTSPTFLYAQPLESTSIPAFALHDDGAYSAITHTERLNWVAEGLIGRPAVLATVGTVAWQTAWNTPPEWGRTWRGAGQRLAQREADVALSSGIEAGLGALWYEDPRYLRSGQRGVRRRMAYAVRTVFIAPRRDGRMAPAWGRYVGNSLNNIIENAWLPPSQRTWESTVTRTANGMLFRLATNVWAEFRPDVLRLLARRRGEEL
jgi:hypothetical protein